MESMLTSEVHVLESEFRAILTCQQYVLRVREPGLLKTGVLASFTQSCILPISRATDHLPKPKLTHKCAASTCDLQNV